MRNIHLKFVTEAYDENGLLTDFQVNCPEDFNFGYDVVDDIALAEPERPAMVWCNPEGEEHFFTFGDMKRWSDKTANYFAAHGIGHGDPAPSLPVLVRGDRACKAGRRHGACHVHAQRARPGLSPEPR